MTVYKFLGALTATSLLALMLSTPVYAIHGPGTGTGSDAAQGDTGKGDTGKGDTGTGGTGTGGGDKGDDGKGGDSGGDKGDGGGKDPGPDPDPTPDPTPDPDPTPEPDRDAPEKDKPTKGKDYTCNTNKRSLISREGTYVGHIDGITCRDDGTVLYKVTLAKAFNSEAKRVTLKTRVRPINGKNVRVQLTDMQIKKLIWMNARH